VETLKRCILPVLLNLKFLSLLSALLSKVVVPLPLHSSSVSLQLLDLMLLPCLTSTLDLDEVMKRNEVDDESVLNLPLLLL